jgi:hypothetical protein
MASIDHACVQLLLLTSSRRPGQSMRSVYLEIMWMLLMWTYFGFVIVGITGTATSAAALVIFVVKLGLVALVAFRAVQSIAAWYRQQRAHAAADVATVRTRCRAERLCARRSILSDDVWADTVGAAFQPLA